MYTWVGIHPIPLRAKDRKHAAKGGSRGLWAADRGMVVANEVERDKGMKRKGARESE